ncbi:Uncharacterised protein [Legionella lansingensis]|uniref:Uncharacterized protein n=1 Tax=Legionella lansingensis TaxID=45067 RepID=A0A0W0VRD3_9GAMM|nr:hypothetical protein [Legionella lansingensis]KTD22700.1 hypothetical protein Llan_1190 [Legionella lansingensis]SNV55458.1 Uncharacterised protein [Legionella lansingensis]
MPFQIPSMPALLEAATKLDQAYAKNRTINDKNRWFNSLRPATHNTDRLQDIQFIKNLSKYISENKFLYEKIDPAFKGKSYPWVIAPFLKEALSGAMLLDLSKITVSYGDEKATKKNSALAKVILDVFTINGLSEVPINKRKTCLESLKQCIEAIDTFTKENGQEKIQWHPGKSNKIVLTEITHELEALTKKIESEEGHGQAATLAF